MQAHKSSYRLGSCWTGFLRESWSSPEACVPSRWWSPSGSTGWSWQWSFGSQWTFSFSCTELKLSSGTKAHESGSKSWSGETANPRRACFIHCFGSTERLLSEINKHLYFISANTWKVVSKHVTLQHTHTHTVSRLFVTRTWTPVCPLPHTLYMHTKQQTSSRQATGQNAPVCANVSPYCPLLGLGVAESKSQQDVINVIMKTMIWRLNVQFFGPCWQTAPLNQDKGTHHLHLTRWAPGCLCSVEFLN